MTAIKQGDPAPDVRLTDQHGRSFDLAEFRGKKWVVLFFYPKDDSPVCTREACVFRDTYEQFVGAGAEVVGVSSDSVESHKTFAEKQRLPFRLLSDADGAVRKAFGVPKTMGVFPGRVTYVIDPGGVVRLTFNSQLNAAGHVAEALRVLRESGERPSPK
ncbi:MAG TPA: peroxiredoxin [Planctomycetota bacterium]|jgi:peroxiredoxin Q/BCP